MKDFIVNHWKTILLVFGGLAMFPLTRMLCFLLLEIDIEIEMILGIDVWVLMITTLILIIWVIVAKIIKKHIPWKVFLSVYFYCLSSGASIFLLYLAVGFDSYPIHSFADDYRIYGGVIYSKYGVKQTDKSYLYIGEYYNDYSREINFVGMYQHNENLFFDIYDEHWTLYDDAVLETVQASNQTLKDFMYRNIGNEINQACLFKYSICFHRANGRTITYKAYNYHDDSLKDDIYWSVNNHYENGKLTSKSFMEVPVKVIHRPRYLEEQKK